MACDDEWLGSQQSDLSRLDQPMQHSFQMSVFHPCLSCACCPDVRFELYVAEHAPVTVRTNQLLNRPVSQLIMNSSINQSINQSIHPFTHQSVKQSIKQTSNQFNKSNFTVSGSQQRAWTNQILSILLA